MSRAVILILAFLALSSVTARPQKPPAGKQRAIQPHVGDGNFYWEYTNPDGSSAYQTGFLKPIPGTDESIMVHQGAFTSFGKDGTLTLTQYIADEKGYQPQTLMMPLPEEVRRKIKY